MSVEEELMFFTCLTHQTPEIGYHWGQIDYLPNLFGSTSRAPLIAAGDRSVKPKPFPPFSPHPLALFAMLREGGGSGWCQAGVHGQRGLEGEGPPSGAWGQTQIWGYSSAVSIRSGRCIFLLSSRSPSKCRYLCLLPPYLDLPGNGL